jgi:hypothetical protein
VQAVQVVADVVHNVHLLSQLVQICVVVSPYWPLGQVPTQLLADKYNEPLHDVQYDALFAHVVHVPLQLVHTWVDTYG